MAPYILLPDGDNVAGLTVDQIFAGLDQSLTQDVIPWIQSDAAVAKAYGVQLVAYEGGQALVPGPNELNFSVMAAALNDPRMYQLYVNYINDWTRAGGGLFNEFTLDGVPGQFGFWGMLPNVLATGSQEYNALVSLIGPRRPPPPPRPIRASPITPIMSSRNSSTIRSPIRVAPAWAPGRP